MTTSKYHVWTNLAMKLSYVLIWMLIEWNGSFGFDEGEEEEEISFDNIFEMRETTSSCMQTHQEQKTTVVCVLSKLEGTSPHSSKLRSYLRRWNTRKFIKARTHKAKRMHKFRKMNANHQNRHKFVSGGDKLRKGMFKWYHANLRGAVCLISHVCNLGTQTHPRTARTSH